MLGVGIFESGLKHRGSPHPMSSARMNTILGRESAARSGMQIDHARQRARRNFGFMMTRKLRVWNKNSEVVTWRMVPTLISGGVCKIDDAPRFASLTRSGLAAPLA